MTHALPAGAPTPPPERSWRFGPAHTPELWPMLTAARLYIALSVAAATFVLSGLATGLYTFAGFAVMTAVGFGLAKVRVGERPIEGWIAPAFRWSWTVVRRRRSWQSDAPSRGAGKFDPPPELGGWKTVTATLFASSPNPLPLGLVFHRPTGTWLAGAKVTGSPLHYLDRGPQEQRLAVWGQGCGSFAARNSPVHRLQWVERTAYGDNVAAIEYFKANRVNGAEDYAALLDGVAGGLVHETFVFLAITNDSAKSALAAYGAADTGATNVLWAQLEHLKSLFPVFDVDPLTATSLNRYLRTQFEPTATGFDPDVSPWPTSTRQARGYYQTDDTFHITSWVAKLPRERRNPAFFGHLLNDPDVRYPRSISLTAKFVPADVALSKIEGDQVTRESVDLFKSDRGYRIGARNQRTADDMTRRENELAENVPGVEMSLYYTATGPTLDLAKEAHQAATLSAQRIGGAELRIAYGEQAEAFVASALPSGKGRP